MPNFKSYNISPQVSLVLQGIGFAKPTHTQELAIAPILRGKNVIVNAPTGSGKTHAYLLPILEKILTNNNFKTVIVTPTKELVLQVRQQINVLTSNLITNSGRDDPKVTPLPKDNFFVTTPEKLLSTENRKINCFVLDEVDAIFNTEVWEDLASYVAALSSNVQKLFFSATIAPDLQRKLAKLTPPATIVNCDNSTNLPHHIAQFAIQVSDEKQKPAVLKQLLKSRKSYLSIIFVNRQNIAQKIAKIVAETGLKPLVLHGGLNAAQRKAVFNQIPEQKCLVTTDLMARGIDFPEIDLVIHYDCPLNYNWYLHRIGRTGRLGKSGESQLLVVPEERGLLLKIRNHKLKITLNKFRGDKIVSTTPPKIKPRVVDPLTREINAIKAKYSRSIKPNYKKKISAEIHKLRQKQKRAYINAKYAQLKRTRAKAKVNNKGDKNE